MTNIVPYLTFAGKCREAMSFYQSVLGGELQLQTFGESAAATQMPAELSSHIMHSHLTGGSLSLMASDSAESGELHAGNMFNLMLMCTTEAEVNQLFDALAVDGQVNHPLEDTFWNARFGTLTDKFGISWMLHFDKSLAA